MTTEHNELSALTENELMTEMILELRKSTRLLIYLIDETGDFYMTVKEDIQNRQLW